MKAAMPALDPLASYASRTRGAGALGRHGVGEHGDERRLVCDQGGHIVGISRHERERGHRAPAAREHLDRAGAERLDDGVHVVAWTVGELSIRPSLRVLRPRPRGS